MEQQYNQTTDLFMEEPVVYAGFWPRLGAAFIDGIVISIPQAILTYQMSEQSASLTSIVVAWLYYSLMESGSWQATLGKKALNIIVTDESGGKISFGHATGRYFGKYVSIVILFIGYLMMLWDDKNQTLHDKMAGTLVVKS